MGKLDHCSAYRTVPVHPLDYLLLAIKRQGVVYYDKTLPFGLCSTPKPFMAVADGLTWGLCCRGVTSLPCYLDDFFCAPSTSTACSRALEVAVPLHAELGLLRALANLERAFNSGHIPEY